MKLTLIQASRFPITRSANAPSANAFSATSPVFAFLVFNRTSFTLRVRLYALAQIGRLPRLPDFERRCGAVFLDYLHCQPRLSGAGRRLDAASACPGWDDAGDGLLSL